MTFHCRYGGQPVPDKRHLQLCQRCRTEPIWLAAIYMDAWILSAFPFSTELDAALFNASSEYGIWTHVVNFAARTVTPLSAYGFRR